MKNNHKLLSIYAIKKICVCVCMYKMNTFALFTSKAWGKNGIEVVEIWISQRHIQEKLGVINISDKTQYYSSEFKKMICWIQECGKYQPCRMFIENAAAVEITMSSVKTSSYF